MCDGKSSRLLRKAQWKFPDENDGGVNKNGKCSVLELAGQIAADPRVRTKQGQMAFAPTARDIGEHGQNRQFIIVIPKQKRIVPKEKQTKEDDD
jgi:hypothetical protein